MAASFPQSTPPLSGDDRNLVRVDDTYLAPTFEDKVRIFWDRNGRLITAILSVVAVFLIGRWAFDLYAERRNAQIRADYAAAADSAALSAFVAANPSAPLAGVARLRLADEAYAARNYAEAVTLYREAAPLLAGNPLAGRATLGASIALIQSGDTTAASSLETLAGDNAQPAVIRAEAAYHRAVLARDAADTSAARTWATLATTVDTSGLWSQRASQLLAALPAEAAPATASVSAAPADEARVTVPTISTQ